jgi:hypothetical protein
MQGIAGHHFRWIHGFFEGKSPSLSLKRYGNSQIRKTR